MRGFFGISVAYLGAAILAVQLVRGDGVHSAISSVRATATVLPNADPSLIALGVIVVGSLLLWRVWGPRRIAARLGFAVLGTICFLSAFALIKTLLSAIQPFYADPYFADLDAWLHGGVDPWRLSHQWASHLPMAWIEPLYLHVWGPISLTLPILFAAQDPDETRVRRFLILYGVAWVGIGNIGALAGMSAGPVYYARVLGDDRFGALNAAINGGVFAHPLITTIQDQLWRLYADGTQLFIGSGISAFPSVHVAVASVMMLYVCERAFWLAPLAVVFLAAIQFLSVYTGYHYAIDGYFSMLVVGATWAALRHRAGVRDRADAGIPAPAPLPAE